MHTCMYAYVNQLATKSTVLIYMYTAEHVPMMCWRDVATVSYSVNAHTHTYRTVRVANCTVSISCL